jgi:hypothetical protein
MERKRRGQKSGRKKKEIEKKETTRERRKIRKIIE